MYICTYYLGMYINTCVLSYSVCYHVYCIRSTNTLMTKVLVLISLSIIILSGRDQYEKNGFQIYCTSKNHLTTGFSQKCQCNILVQLY